MTLSRTYTYRDVDMLTASKIIINSLNANLSDLSMVRTNWTSEYTSGLALKVDNVLEIFLGKDKTKNLREATKVLVSIQKPALSDLAFLKTQIKVDFGKEADEIIKGLGYNKYLKEAQQKDQEALIELLFAFKKGMTEKLKQAIVDKGTNPALIDRILAYATQMSEANVMQEGEKSGAAELTQEASSTLDEVYKEVIGICKIASKYYKTDPLKKKLFTFSAVVEKLNAAKKANETESPED